MRNFLVLTLLTLCLTANSQDVYVNRVWYLGDNQFFVYLNYNEGYDWKTHEEIEPFLGEPETEDFETTRRKLPPELATKYFNMPWTSELWLFDNSTYSKLTELEFIGVEYFEDMITSSYIAVFKATNFIEPTSFADMNHYCISSNSNGRIKSDFKAQPVDSKAYGTELKKRFGFTDRKRLKTQSIEFNNSTLTLCSFLGENYNSNSAIMKSNDQKHIILLEILANEYVMWEMTLTPLFIKDMPVIVMDMGVPDTDHNWTQIAIFNGTNYVLQFPDDKVTVR